jgi:hypothetical protein
MKVPATIEIVQVREDDARFAATCQGLTGCAPTPHGALIELAHLLGAVPRSIDQVAVEPRSSVNPSAPQTTVPDGA